MRHWTKVIRAPGALVLAGGVFALAACQSAPPSTIGALGANAIGCKSRETVTTLHASGDRFQRTADDHLASGGCRVFAASSPVAGKRVEGGLLRFIDVASGIVFWAYPPG